MKLNKLWISLLSLLTIPSVAAFPTPGDVLRIARDKLMTSTHIPRISGNSPELPAFVLLGGILLVYLIIYIAIKKASEKIHALESNRIIHALTAVITIITVMSAPIVENLIGLFAFLGGLGIFALWGIAILGAAYLIWGGIYGVRHTAQTVKGWSQNLNKTAEDMREERIQLRERKVENTKKKLEAITEGNINLFNRTKVVPPAVWNEFRMLEKNVNKIRTNDKSLLGAHRAIGDFIACIPEKKLAYFLTSRTGINLIDKIDRKIRDISANLGTEDMPEAKALVLRNNSVRDPALKNEIDKIKQRIMQEGNRLKAEASQVIRRLYATRHGVPNPEAYVEDLVQKSTRALDTGLNELLVVGKRYQEIMDKTK